MHGAEKPAKKQEKPAKKQEKPAEKKEDSTNDETVPSEN